MLGKEKVGWESDGDKFLDWEVVGLVRRKWGMVEVFENEIFM